MDAGLELGVTTGVLFMQYVLPGTAAMGTLLAVPMGTPLTGEKEGLVEQHDDGQEDGVEKGYDPVRGTEEDTCKCKGGWETWWRVLDVAVRAVLVSTMRPGGERSTARGPRGADMSWCPGVPSRLSPGNMFSSRTPTATPDPTGLGRSSEQRGGGRGLRGELRTRPGERRGRVGGGKLIWEGQREGSFWTGRTWAVGRLGPVETTGLRRKHERSFSPESKPDSKPERRYRLQK